MTWYIEHHPYVDTVPQSLILESGFAWIKEAVHQLLCSLLLFCFRELNHFLEISVWGPQKILQVSWNSILENRNSILDPWKSKLKTRASKLDSRKLRGLRIELRLSTYLWAVLYIQTSLEYSPKKICVLIG